MLPIESKVLSHDDDGNLYNLEQRRTISFTLKPTTTGECLFRKVFGKHVDVKHVCVCAELSQYLNVPEV